MPPTKLLKLLGFLVVLLSVPLMSGAESLAPAVKSDPNAVKLLRESMDAPKHLSFVGRMETLRWGSRSADATIFRVEHRAPDLTRRWFEAPRSLYGDYVITQGITSYQFDVRHQTVSVSRNPAIDELLLQQETYNLLSQNYGIVPGPAENVAGRRALSIDMINKFTGERIMRIWLDAATHLVLQRVVYHSDGSIASQTRFDGLRYTDNIPAAIFSTQTPPGFKVAAMHDYSKPTADRELIAKNADFKTRSPHYLPEGFQVVSADMSVVNGVKTVHYLYSDGIRSLSLFENAHDAAADFGKRRVTAIKFEDHTGQYVEDGPTTLLTWRESGLTFALVGEIGRRELTKIAASVVP